MSMPVIKTFKDLEEVAGKDLAKVIKGLRKHYMKRVPTSVTFTTRKPSFGLDDGGMLNAYAYDLKTFEVISSAYCGSADSALNHARQQFGEGEIPSDSTMGIIFTESSPSTGNHPWFVTIVTPNIPKVENDPMDDFNYVGHRMHY